MTYEDAVAMLADLPDEPVPMAAFLDHCEENNLDMSRLLSLPERHRFKKWAITAYICIQIVSGKYPGVTPTFMSQRKRFHDDWEVGLKLEDADGWTQFIAMDSNWSTDCKIICRHIRKIFDGFIVHLPSPITGQ